MSERVTFHHIWQPPQPGDRRTLLLLHGTGGDEHDLLPLGRMLAPGAGVLSPRGASMEEGMPRWFRRRAPGVLDTEDVMRQAEALAHFVTSAATRYGFDGHALTGVGFSNGANMLAALMLLGHGMPRWAVLLRPMLPLEPARLPNLQGYAALVASGDRDAMTPPDHPAKLIGALQRAGADVDTHTSHAGHELTKADLEAAALFIEKRVH